MRLNAGLWVSAFIRRCQVQGAFVAVVRRGAEEAGAIHIKVNRLDGTVILFAPAPQALFEEGRPSSRQWLALREGAAMPEADADRILARECGFDPDLWIVELEDRGGRSFLADDETA